MIKKLFPLALSLMSLFLMSLMWEKIKLPYNFDNQILGEYYEKKFNPTNEVLRFIIFIGLPVCAYFFSYLKFNSNILSFNKNSQNFFLKKKNSYKDDKLDIYFYYFIFLIFIEFISLDFNRFINLVDTFHMGTFLVPPMNFLLSNELLKSTLYDYGFIANNLGTIYHNFFNYYSIGSIYFIFLIFIFLIKFSLILISKKICDFLNYDRNIKIVFFCLFAFISINLPNYYDQNSFFSPRFFLYLFAIYFLVSQLSKNSNLNLNYFFIGFFSILTIFWWYDVGAYFNALILISLFYLLIFKEFKNFFIIFFSLLLFWIVFISLLPINELKEFWFQLKLPYSKSYEYLLGIEYKTPFSKNSARWTKALLIIFFSSLLLINFNFDKSLNIDGRVKIFLNFFFISGILLFKTALMRSDGVHIRYSSGIYTLVFLFLVIFFLFNFFVRKKNFLIKLKKYKFFSIFHIFLIIFGILFILNVFDKKNNIEVKKSVSNILNFKNNVLNLILAKDQSFLDKDTLDVLKRYELLSKDDKCIQILSDDIAFSYFLRKKTCTKFYISAQIINGVTERQFIEEFKLTSPNIILFDSKNGMLTNKLNMPNVINYINANYIFFEDFKGYIFYKIKKK